MLLHPRGNLRIGLLVLRALHHIVEREHALLLEGLRRQVLSLAPVGQTADVDALDDVLRVQARLGPGHAAALRLRPGRKGAYAVQPYADTLRQEFGHAQADAGDHTLHDVAGVLHGVRGDMVHQRVHGQGLAADYRGVPLAVARTFGVVVTNKAETELEFLFCHNCYYFF